MIIVLISIRIKPPRRRFLKTRTTLDTTYEGRRLFRDQPRESISISSVADQSSGIENDSSEFFTIHVGATVRSLVSH